MRSVFPTAALELTLKMVKISYKKLFKLIAKLMSDINYRAYRN